MRDTQRGWRGRRVLVTGAAGFIGSHLTERLVKSGAAVRVLCHYNSRDSRGWLDDSEVQDDVEVVTGDVADVDIVTDAVRGVEVVFHLAALIAIPYSYRAPGSYVRTNVEGTTNVCRAALAAGVQRVMHTSTSEVYGTARYVPIDEQHPQQGQSPYAASKIGADKMVEAYHHSYGLPAVTVRPFNTYGPRQSARAVIPTIISQACRTRVIALGNTHTTRDFMFVEDAVEGMMRAAETDSLIGDVVNLGTGVEVTIDQVASMVIEILGVDAAVAVDPARFRPTASEVDRLCAANEKAKRLMNWEPRWLLRDGLRVTANWIAGNLDRFRPAAYAT